VDQIGNDVVRVTFEFLQSEAACVVERNACDAAKNRIDVLDFTAREFLLLFENLILCRLQDAVETAKNCHGQHDILILIRAIGSAKKISDRPNEAYFSTEVVHAIFP